jgi:nitroreductase
VEKEKLMQILRAGMQAPSACNQQPWEFYVVTNPEKIKALSKATPYAGCAANAPVVIVPVYRKEGLIAPDFAQIDLSIAQENMWLETDAVQKTGHGHNIHAEFLSQLFNRASYQLVRVL